MKATFALAVIGASLTTLVAAQALGADCTQTFQCDPPYECSSSAGNICVDTSSQGPNQGVSSASTGGSNSATLPTLGQDCTAGFTCQPPYECSSSAGNICVDVSGGSSSVSSAPSAAGGATFPSSTPAAVNGINSVRSSVGVAISSIRSSASQAVSSIRSSASSSASAPSSTVSGAASRKETPLVVGMIVGFAAIFA